jgi:lipoate-protein ligase B
MSYWDGIIACGIDYPVISLADLLAPVPPMRRVKEEVISAFSDIFQYEVALKEFDFLS